MCHEVRTSNVSSITSCDHEYSFLLHSSLIISDLFDTYILSTHTHIYNNNYIRNKFQKIKKGVVIVMKSKKTNSKTSHLAMKSLTHWLLLVSVHANTIPAG